MKPSILGIFTLLFSLISFAGIVDEYIRHETNAKKVCSVVSQKDTTAGIQCDRYIEQNSDFDPKYLYKCLRIAELAKKVTSNSAQDGLTCLQAILHKKLKDVPKSQIDFCERLENSNSSRYVLDCIAYDQPPQLFEICKKTCQIGDNFRYAGKCLEETRKFKFSNMAEITEAQKCYRMEQNKAFDARPWDETIDCLRNAAPSDSVPTNRPAPPASTSFQ
jgi:hypothetical protein